MNHLVHPQTKVGQYAIALGAFAVGTLAAWWFEFSSTWTYLLGGGTCWTSPLDTLLSSAWCSLAIVWFPFAAVNILRRTRTEGVAFGAALVSLIAGYDGVIRLVHLTYRGC